MNLKLIIALAALIIAPQIAAAATITVDSTAQEEPFVNDGDCTLGEAIKAANDDAAVDNCPTGSGDDVIELDGTATYTLTDNVGITSTGTPEVTSTITINGNGATLERDAASPTDFRLFRLDTTGALTVNDLTISGGSTSTSNGGAGPSYGGQDGRYYECDDRHELDKNVHGRARCILEWVTDGVSNDGCFMSVGALSAMEPGLD